METNITFVIQSNIFGTFRTEHFDSYAAALAAAGQFDCIRRLDEVLVETGRA